MKISYAICVCNEYNELNSLLSFLSRVADNEDEINILVDSGKVTEEVRAVLKKFEKRIVVNERKFCGNFSKHRNYHITKCKGEYIFVLDADEIPQKALVKNIKNFPADGKDSGVGKWIEQEAKKENLVWVHANEHFSSSAGECQKHQKSIIGHGTYN